jgi:hypothetical protein
VRDANPSTRASARSIFHLVVFIWNRRDNEVRSAAGRPP